MRAFGSGKSADAAEAMVNAAKTLTGDSSGETAVNKIIADPALQLQYQQLLSNERLKFREMELADKQAEHKQQQDTIRTGDTAEDPYVRQTRPKIVRQSFYGSALYLLAFEGMQAFGKGTGADWELLALLMSPVLAYFGFRTGDKWAEVFRKKPG